MSLVVGVRTWMTRWLAHLANTLLPPPCCPTPDCGNTPFHGVGSHRAQICFRANWNFSECPAFCLILPNQLQYIAYELFDTTRQRGNMTSLYENWCVLFQLGSNLFGVPIHSPCERILLSQEDKHYGSTRFRFKTHDGSAVSV